MNIEVSWYMYTQTIHGKQTNYMVLLVKKSCINRTLELLAQSRAWWDDLTMAGCVSYF